MSPARFTADAVRDTAALVLRNRSYTATARWIAAQIAMMPTAELVASKLVASVEADTLSVRPRAAA